MNHCNAAQIYEACLHYFYEIFNPLLFNSKDEKYYIPNGFIFNSMTKEWNIGIKFIFESISNSILSQMNTSYCQREVHFIRVMST